MPTNRWRAFGANRLAAIVLLLLLCITHQSSHAFVLQPTARHIYRKTYMSVAEAINTVNGLIAIPETIHSMDKTRFTFLIKGLNPSAPVTGPLFRAELKKELSFYRGCTGTYRVVNGIKVGADSVGSTIEIIGEGKVKSVLKCIEWLNTLTLSIEERKVNFQGPTIQIQILQVAFADCSGKFNGFSFLEEPPMFNADATPRGGIEEKNMLGTDESV